MKLFIRKISTQKIKAYKLMIYMSWKTISSSRIRCFVICYSVKKKEVFKNTIKCVSTIYELSITYESR